jgi:hypothetical protein
MLLNDMLHQGNTVPQTIYEAKQIICSLGLEVENPCVQEWFHSISMWPRMIAFYIMVLNMKTLRNALFVDSTNSIVDKMAVMTRTATEEKAGLKRCFGTFLSFLVRSIGLQTKMS